MMATITMGDDGDDKKQRHEKTKTGMMSIDINTDETSKWANLQKTRNDNFWHNMQQRRLSLLENFSANNEWPCTRLTQMKFTIIEMRSWPDIWTRQKGW